MYKSNVVNAVTTLETMTRELFGSQTGSARRDVHGDHAMFEKSLSLETPPGVALYETIPFRNHSSNITLFTE